MKRSGLDLLAQEIVRCRRCPRLVEWRERVARERRAAFAAEQYWGRPLPGFGDPRAPVLVFGLAPAAHGGNRTGRIFTGDRSGDFLFASLWRTGFANQPTSVSRDDGLRLRDVWIMAAVRCAPPANRPTPQERDNCLPWSVQELGLLDGARAIVCLGGFAWDAALRLCAAACEPAALVPRPRPRFAHGAEHSTELWSAGRQAAPRLGGRQAEPRLGRRRSRRLMLVGCYHPSQQNTFTGRLTEPMMDGVFLRARELAGLAKPR